jgi:hypothetical protein
MTKKLTADYAVNPGRVYMSGLSAGAIMSTVMTATYPDLYAGEASWAGCSYLCSDSTGDLAYARMGAYARAYPIIMFAGSADYLVNPAMTGMELTGAVGMNDIADDGQHNNSVTVTNGPETFGDPTQISPNTGPDDGSRGDAGTCLFVTTNTHGNNPCPGSDLGWSSYPYTVTRFGNATASNIVESWYIHGISHNYSGGSTEGTFADPLGPDTTTAAWNFLEAHARVPVTTIDAGPAEGSTVRTKAPAFSFSSRSPGATFNCRYDVDAFASCTSPYTAILKNGTHRFDVYATDTARSSGPVASRVFTVRKS